jgi:nitronate monooxygenase
MAGGPSSTALIAAVGDAGGLGVVPAGYLTPEAFEASIAAVEAATPAPYGANLFLPGPPTGDPDGVARHAHALEPLARRLGVALGSPRWDDDALDAKLEIVLAHRPALVSFTFGVPDRELVGRIRERTDAVVAATVTTPEEALLAAAGGVDALVLQGAEAGGHRGILVDDPSHPAGGPLIALRELVAAVRARTSLPLVAGGGLTDGAGVRAVLEAGAAAAALGTAFLATPEAGTSASIGAPCWTAATPARP